MYAEAFRIFQMLLRNLFHIGSQKAIRNIGMGTRVGGDLHVFLPRTVAVAGFFKQLPLCGNQRRSIFFLTYAGTKFIGCLLQAMSVLADKNELPVARDGDGIYPIGIFQYVIGRDMITVRQDYMVFAYGEPRGFMQVLAGNDFPGLSESFIGFMIFIL
mgnify:CR=1 FL=1